jgi:hypothetical protein
MSLRADLLPVFLPLASFEIVASCLPLLFLPSFADLLFRLIVFFVWFLNNKQRELNHIL